MEGVQGWSNTHSSSIYPLKGVSAGDDPMLCHNAIRDLLRAGARPGSDEVLCVDDDTVEPWPLLLEPGMVVRLSTDIEA